MTKCHYCQEKTKPSLADKQLDNGTQKVCHCQDSQTADYEKFIREQRANDASN